MAHEDTVVQGSRVQKEARGCDARHLFGPLCLNRGSNPQCKQLPVLAWTVHTAFVPSQTAHDGQQKMQKLAPFSRGSGLLLLPAEFCLC